MNNQETHKCSLAAIATALSMLMSLPLAHANAGGARIDGTWINDVKIVACASPQTVLAAFQSMSTYLRDGTLIEGGGPATPPPAVSRSAGHGIWERTGRDTIQVHFRSHSFDAIGRLVRITEVTSMPQLTRGDDPNTVPVERYYLAGWGTNRITNLDPATGQVISVSEGCNYATSRPVLFDN